MEQWQSITTKNEARAHGLINFNQSPETHTKEDNEEGNIGYKEISENN